ncbi:MAG: DDE-type integrase/transposase/recombinase [Thermoplasmata archaeon]
MRRKGEQHWHRDAIDKETRFLVGSHISRTRTLEDAKTFMKDCALNTPRPTAIVTDGLEAYGRGINKVFYRRYKHRKVKHIRTEAIRRTKIRIHN